MKKERKRKVKLNKIIVATDITFACYRGEGNETGITKKIIVYNVQQAGLLVEVVALLAV